MYIVHYANQLEKILKFEGNQRQLGKEVGIDSRRTAAYPQVRYPKWREYRNKQGKRTWMGCRAVAADPRKTSKKQENSDSGNVILDMPTLVQFFALCTHVIYGVS
jgi:hypothetical protein